MVCFALILQASFTGLCPGGHASPSISMNQPSFSFCPRYNRQKLPINCTRRILVRNEGPPNQQSGWKGTSLTLKTAKLVNTAMELVKITNKATPDVLFMGNSGGRCNNIHYKCFSVISRIAIPIHLFCRSFHPKRATIEANGILQTCSAESSTS